MQVKIIDARPAWQRKEDNLAMCFNRCHDFYRCQTRQWTKCKHGSGQAIPKWRDVV